MAATEALEGRRLPFAPRWRWTLTVLGAAVPTALAAGLDLHALGARSLWLDEGDAYAVASQHGTRLLHAALGDGGNMLAYYLGLHYWIALFGSTEFSMRLPSALAGIATVPVCFFLLLRLFDLRAAVYGAIFVAVSVPLVWYAQDARAYAVGLFLVCASTLAFVIAVQTKRVDAWVAYALLSVLAIYTILLTVLLPLAHGASLLFRRQRPEMRTGAFLAVCGCAALVLLPLALVAVSHGDKPIQWLPAPGPILGSGNQYLVYFLASARSGNVPIRPAASHAVVLAMIVCWALGVVLLARNMLRREWTETTWGLGLLVAWFVVPPVGTYLISLVIHPALGDRYIIDALPPASMLAAVVLSRARPWPLAVCVGLIVVVLRAEVTMPSYGVPLENWRQAAATVATDSKSGDCIAFFVADGYNPFAYYASHSHLISKEPRLVLPDTSWSAHTPYVLAPESIPASRMLPVVESCSRVWLLVSHALGHPPGPGVLPYQARVYTQDMTLHNELDASYHARSTMTITGLSEMTLYVRRRSRRLPGSTRELAVR